MIYVDVPSSEARLDGMGPHRVLAYAYFVE